MLIHRVIRWKMEVLLSPVQSTIFLLPLNERMPILIHRVVSHSSIAPCSALMSNS